MTRSFPPGVGVRWPLWVGKLVPSHQTHQGWVCNDTLLQWTKLGMISSCTKRSIKIPFGSDYFLFEASFVISVFHASVCDSEARKACLSDTTAKKHRGEGLSSATTHLKSFQIPGKLGLFGLLHVQLLHQVFWAPAVFPFLGLFLWSRGGWSSQSVQRFVQHSQLWGRKRGQGLTILWPWKHTVKRSWTRERKEQLGSATCELFLL